MAAFESVGSSESAAVFCVVALGNIKTTAAFMSLCRLKSVAAAGSVGER